MFSLARVKRVCMRCFAMCLVLVSIVHFAPLVYDSVFSELVFSMSVFPVSVRLGLRSICGGSRCIRSWFVVG